MTTKYIFTSTDIVYDGRLEDEPFPSKKKYSIPDASPINSYGKSKFAFEEAIRGSSLPCSIVLRLSNMLGSTSPYTSSSIGKKFFQWLYENLKSKSQVKLRYDEYRSFVYVEDVISIIESIVDSDVDVIRAAIANSSSGSMVPRISRSVSGFVDVINSSGISSISISGECCHGVFNVGGPHGLSRLELAYILSKKLNIDLVLPEEDLKRIEDKVRSAERRSASASSSKGESSQENCDFIDQTDKILAEFLAGHKQKLHGEVQSDIGTEAGAAASSQWLVGVESSNEVTTSLVRSPRCIVMDSVETERVFGVKFTSIVDASGEIIQALTSVLSPL